MKLIDKELLSAVEVCSWHKIHHIAHISLDSSLAYRVTRELARSLKLECNRINSEQTDGVYGFGYSFPKFYRIVLFEFVIMCEY